MIQNKTEGCHKCKVKDLKKKPNKKDFQQKRTSREGGNQNSHSCDWQWSYSSYHYVHSCSIFSTNLLEGEETSTFLSAVIPATDQHASWCLATLPCTTVASLCCGAHTERRQARSRDRAAAEWRWLLWLGNHIWHRQSPGSDHWSSSWAGTPRVNPQRWTEGSARPRRCPVEYEW